VLSVFIIELGRHNYVNTGRDALGRHNYINTGRDALGRYYYINTGRDALGRHYYVDTGRDALERQVMWLRGWRPGSNSQERHHVRNGPGTQVTSCSMCSGGFSPRIEQPWSKLITRGRLDIGLSLCTVSFTVRCLDTGENLTQLLLRRIKRERAISCCSWRWLFMCSTLQPSYPRYQCISTETIAGAGYVSGCSGSDAM
jgi:hypothetical protein